MSTPIMNHTPSRGLRARLVAVLLLAAGTLVTATGCASDKQVIAQAQQMHSGLEPAVMEDPVLSEYIQTVGDRIIDSAQEMARQGYGGEGGEDRTWMFDRATMRFHFVNSKTLNAFTTGGNHMYIYTQLFQTVETEDALAAVMAHEFAHVYGRHVQGGMNRQYAILAAAAAAGAGGYALGGDGDQRLQYAGYGAGLGMLAGQFVGMGFTRKDETEADKMGFNFYVRAGWDPEKFDDFFVKMIEMGYDKGPEFLSSHPSMATRVNAIREWVKELPPEAKEWRRPPVAEGSRFKELQRRSAEVGKTMPSDTSLENAQELLAALPRSCLTPAIHEDQQKAEQRVMSKMQAEQEPPQKQQPSGRAAKK